MILHVDKAVLNDDLEDNNSYISSRENIIDNL